MSTTELRYHTTKLVNAIRWMRDNWDGDINTIDEFYKNAMDPFQSIWDKLDNVEKKNMFGWVQEKLNTVTRDK